MDNTSDIQYLAHHLDQGRHHIPPRALMPVHFNAVDLSDKNTMALRCQARYVAVLNRLAQVPNAMMRAPFILSQGSNVILPNTLDRYVVMPRFKGMHCLSENQTTARVLVMGGEVWDDWVRTSIGRGWYGLENLALIPGLVGAAPVQNIGAYGAQVGDFVECVIAFDPALHVFVVLDNAGCAFGYRESLFKHKTYLIVAVVFALHKDKMRINTQYAELSALANPSPLEIMETVIAIRQKKLPNPTILPNVGSYFKNPIITRAKFDALRKSHPHIIGYRVDSASTKVAAGWLIEAVGLKGTGIAPILTHKRQSLVLTNQAPKSATRKDVARTQDLIVQTVKAQFDILLRPEPVWI